MGNPVNYTRVILKTKFEVLKDKFRVGAKLRWSILTAGWSTGPGVVTWLVEAMCFVLPRVGVVFHVKRGDRCICR